MLEGSDAKTETVQGLLLPSPSTDRLDVWWENPPRQPSRRCGTACDKNGTKRVARTTRRDRAVYQIPTASLGGR